jgi:hypothetical protein
VAGTKVVARAIWDGWKDDELADAEQVQLVMGRGRSRRPVEIRGLPDEAASSRQVTRWAVLACNAMVAAVVLAAVAFTSGQQESQQFDDGMRVVAAGLPEGVQLSGTVNYAVEDGNDNIVGYVVNGARGDQEVLCRAIVATGHVECVDLPVNWLYFDDEWK